MGPLRISGTTLRLDCPRQLRRYVAQLCHTVGIVKPGGGTNKWKRPLLPSGQLSRPGRVVKALGHHTTQPNEMPDMQCTMLVKKPTRRSTRILTPSSEVYRLANQFRRENTDVVGDKPVKKDAGEMSMSEDSKQKAWLEHYQRLLNVEFDWDPDHLSYQSPVEGPPIPITIDMVKKAISQMEAGKAPGPSGIVVEMIREAGDMDPSMIPIRDLAVAIIRDGKVPSDWEQSFIVCLYKGKGDALERGNYRGFKVTEQVMKILERILDGLIRQLVSIDDSQFGFVPGRGTTDAIFVVRQLQEKYLAANKRLYMAFVDLEKAFDRIPQKVIWWALRKLGVEEWIVRLVQGMYANARSRVPVGEGYSEEFEMKVGVHSGSVLSPLLFIIVPEALSREFHSWVPWEDLYADDLVIIAESLEECVRRLLTWKEAMEKKGLRVNAGKTKIMQLSVSGERMCTILVNRLED